VEGIAELIISALVMEHPPIICPSGWPVTTPAMPTAASSGKPLVRIERTVVEAKPPPT
jgi:hypothetical protein